MFCIKKIDRIKLPSVAKKFCNNESGSFLPLFGVVSFTLMMSAGVAMDYSRIVHTKSRILAATDSAVLAAGNAMVRGANSPAKVRKIFDNFLVSNLSSSTDIAAGYKVDKFIADFDTGAVTAVVSSDVPMYMAAIAGYEKIPVSAQSKVVFSASAVEVSMMLDVTGSMGGSRLAAMKVAAKSAIDLLMPKNDKSGKVRIGLVPYSEAVNARKYYAKKVTNGASSKCVTERANNTDAKPVGANVIVNNSWRCPDVEIRPLTANRNKLKSDIGKYQAGGATAGHIGVAWSYYMLSEKWQSVWKKKARPADYDSGTKKVAILMTDGGFNTYYLGGNGYVQSNKAAKAICADMKSDKNGAPGITVYSVAFQAPVSSQQTLRECASGADFYFNASSGNELVAVFKNIAENIQKLRLAQ